MESRNDEEIRFLLAETAEKPQGIPSGKMITDSENLSFVYLLEGKKGTVNSILHRQFGHLWLMY